MLFAEKKPRQKAILYKEDIFTLEDLIAFFESDNSANWIMHNLNDDGLIVAFTDFSTAKDVYKNDKDFNFFYPSFHNGIIRLVCIKSTAIFFRFENFDKIDDYFNVVSDNENPVLDIITPDELKDITKEDAHFLDKLFLPAHQELFLRTNYMTNHNLPGLPRIMPERGTVLNNNYDSDEQDDTEATGDD